MLRWGCQFQGRTFLLRVSCFAQILKLCVKSFISKTIMNQFTDFPVDLSDRVYLITGGTGSLGSEVVFELAKRGAGLLLLCRDADDPRTVALVRMIKTIYSNKLICAITCDLCDFKSIRKFEREWRRDSVSFKLPTCCEFRRPRRLDGIICCASCSSTNVDQDIVYSKKKILYTNYLSQKGLIDEFCKHLLIQPANRDIRVVIVTNSLRTDLPMRPETSSIRYCGYRFPSKDSINAAFWTREYWKYFNYTQMLFGLYGMQLQRKLNTEKRPDGLKSKITVSIVDAGLIRSRSNMSYWYGDGESRTRFFKKFTYGLISHSCHHGAQSIMYALLSKTLKSQNEAWYIRNSRVWRVKPYAFTDHKLQESFEKKAEKAINDRIYGSQFSICYGPFGRRNLYKDEETELKLKLWDTICNRVQCRCSHEETKKTKKTERTSP